MSLWRFYGHIVWATKNRLTWITPELEEPLYRLLKEKCNELKGYALAVNGMPDHIHVVTAIHPTVCASELVKHLKGASSRYIHTHFDVPFAWQEGYGIFSVSQPSLPAAINYVQRQKEHHANNTTNRWLESYSEKDDGPIIDDI